MYLSTQTSIYSTEEYSTEMEERIIKLRNKILQEEERLLNKEELEFNEILFLKDILRELENIKIYSKNKISDEQKEEQRKEAYDNLLKVLITK